MLAPMVLGGLQYPVAAAATGAAWSVFRLLYALGYTRTDKTNGKGRMAGSGFWICQLILMGLTATVGVKMVL